MANDLVPFESYEVAKVDGGELVEAIEANLGGERLTQFDLDRVKMPSGGGLLWEVPTLTGVEGANDLEGVIIHHKLVRSYWKESLDDSGGGSPPDCSSPDSSTPYGDPGDALRAEGKGCADCALSDFGSDPDNDRGQACKQSRLLFLARPEDLLPVVVSLAPTSLGPARKFLTRLSSKAVPYYRVQVRIGLERARSAGGVDYAKATFAVGKVLSLEEGAKVKELGDRLRPIFDEATVQESAEARPEPASDVAA